MILPKPFSEPKEKKRIQRTKPIPRSSKPVRTKRPKPVSDRPAAKETRRKDGVWRKDVKARAGQRCEKCGTPATPFMPLDAHHIQGKKAHPAKRHDPQNGIALCREHHEWAHREPAEFRAWRARA